MGKKPFGKDGVFTKAGERIPLVSQGIQEIHRRHGNQDALERAKQNNPLGSEGALTKVAERIPLVSPAIQHLHHRSGNEGAAARASQANPLGANGALTQVGEFVPGLNAGIQRIHRSNGDQEALARARGRNPVGTNGVLTKVGEQIPLLNDGIVALHRASGEPAAEERARAKTLRKILGKNGALTRVAELLPGSNLVAAAMHEANGNPEEARRALHLLRNWKGAGGRDGALTKFAELLPGTDVIAFSAHLTAGAYPEALRCITKSSWVEMSAASIIVSIRCNSVQDIQVERITSKDFVMRPRGSLLLGGALDVFLDLLETRSRSKHHRKAKIAIPKKLADQPSKALEGSLTVLLETLIESFVDRTDFRVGVLLEAIAKGRRDGRFPEWLFPERMPPVSPRFLQDIETAIYGAAVLHTDLPRLRAPTPSPDVKMRRTSQCAAGVSCFACVSCAGLGLKVGGVVACLAGVVAAAVAGTRAASKRATRWIRLHNEQARAQLKHMGEYPGSDATAATSSRPSSSFSGPETQGLVLEVRQPDMTRLSNDLRAYLLKGGLATKLRWTLFFFEGPLRHWFRLLVASDEPAVQYVHSFHLPEQVVECGRVGSPLNVYFPPLHFELVLDFNLDAEGPLFHRLRVACTDPMVQRVVSNLAAQIPTWDLRALDARIAEFQTPVCVDGMVQLRWKAPQLLEFDFREVSTKLSLPD